MQYEFDSLSVLLVVHVKEILCANISLHMHLHTCAWVVFVNEAPVKKPDWFNTTQKTMPHMYPQDVHLLATNLYTSAHNRIWPIGTPSVDMLHLVFMGIS